MRKYGKILAFIIVVALAFSTVGCGAKTAENEHISSEVIEQKPMNASEEVQQNDEEDNTELAQLKEELEELKKNEEEEKKKYEEEKRKALEEERKKAEEEAIRKAEEEEKQRAEEEEKKRAEEEERRKIEEERKAAEEAQLKAEEEKKQTEQKNSFSMMYYLAITAENIRTSKDNRLMLEDIYTSLLNDINPGAIDERTQDHLSNLQDIIKTYIHISVKRDRLQYLYNQNKASAIKSAVPNPLAVLSITNAIDWKTLAISVGYTIVDSVNKYKNSQEAIDKEYLMSGWELDDEEVANIQKNRERAFHYMVDMVQEHNLDGLLTLNEEAIENFVSICSIESPAEKIRRLKSEEDTYKLLGNYWLELADCYFDNDKYKECLSCIDKYNELYTGIYRQDFNYARILPKAVAAAHEVYTGKQYVSTVEKYADEIIKNTSKDDWSSRYFAAEVYLDLYSMTKNQKYLDSAYEIVYDNVTILLGEQRKLNESYLNDLEDITVEEPDYKYLTDKQKKEKEKEYKEEKKRVKEFNKKQREERKTELPHLYDPLILNCELLFALADEKNITNLQKKDIEDILQTETNGTFITKPINNVYSFSNKKFDSDIEVKKDKIVIPADILTSGSVVSIDIVDGNEKTIIDDCVVKKVDRKGDTVESFFADVSSKKLKKYKWTSNSQLTITITYSDDYDKTYTTKYKVKKYEPHWYGDKVEFEKI